MQRVRLRRAQERTALALALALHGASLLALWLWAHQRRALTLVPPAAPQASESELAVELQAAEPRAAPVADRESSALTSLSQASRAPNPNRAGRALATELAPPSDPASAEPPSAAHTAETAPPRVVDLGLGPDAWRGWLPQTAASGPRAVALGPRERGHARRASSTGGLQEGLEARDRALGLGTSGPVVSALYRASHDPIAPETGTAHFRVTVLKSGEVEVSLNDASDHLPAWRAVAGKAEAALRKSPPRIPEPRAGARMLIEITAEEAFPNGVKQKETHGPRLEVQGPRFRATSDAQANLKDLNPLAGQSGEPLAMTKANVDLPGVFVAGTGKVCGYRLGLTPLGPLLQGGCDLANLGAKPQRMVHTHVSEETLF